ncbi:MAG: GldG family protein, partial [Candidatus Methylomirabilis oxyfera]|nr:GldG family protein [Candidatus Methylomirabilis oxyfera]
MRNVARFVAPAGLVLLIGGGIAYNIRPDLKAWMGGILLVGAALILVSLYQSFPLIRAWLDRRSTKVGVNVALMTLLLLGIIGLVEAISAKYNMRIDLTEGKRHTLSDQTKKVVRALPKEVQVTAFYRSDQPDRRSAEELLRQYADLSSTFRFEMVDPDRSPGRAKKYGVTTYGTTVLETKDKEEKITQVDEEHLTNGLVKLLREGKRAVYFLKGHGENELDDASRNGYRQAKEALEKSNYTVKELLLLREPRVPADAAVLVISGPKRDLAESEPGALNTFVERGGKLLVQIDPFAAPSVKAFLRQYGIIAGDDVIVDQFSRVMGGDYLMPVVSKYYSHPITRDFTLASLFPFARSIDAAEKPPEGVSLQKLGETGAGSWAETDKGELNRGQLTFDNGKDRQGPVPMGVVATVEAGKAPKAVSEGTGGPETVAGKKKDASGIEGGP